MTFDEAYKIAIKADEHELVGAYDENDDIICTGDARNQDSHGCDKWEIYFCVWEDTPCDVTVWDDGDVDVDCP